MSTGATMVTANVYHATGYWVPENYDLSEFEGRIWKLLPRAKTANAVGESDKLVEDDIDLFLALAEADKAGRYRVVATGFQPQDPRSDFLHRDVATIPTTSSLTSTGVNSARYPYSVHGWDKTGLGRQPRWTSWCRVNYVRHYFADFFASHR